MIKSKNTHFGRIGECRLQDCPVDEVARVRGVARVTWCGRRTKRIAWRDFVMMKKIAAQLGMLLLLLAVMSCCCRGHVLVQHRRTHGALGATQGTRTIYTTDITAAAHTATRFVALLMLFVFHLWATKNPFCDRFTSYTI